MYVSLWAMFNFVHLFFDGYETGDALHILYSRLQNNMDRLVYRGKWFVPIVYLLMLMKIAFLFYKHK